MKTKIIQIGNSPGIRLPKALLRQSGINGEVRLEVLRQQIVTRPAPKPRQGWEKAFRLMAKRGDDKLLDRKSLAGLSSWDKTGWGW
jgi:antitoxin MazE